MHICSWRMHVCVSCLFGVGKQTRLLLLSRTQGYASWLISGLVLKLYS